jgi:hypothetical protein
MRKTCAMCPTVFDAKRPSAKYCSEKCKKRAQRQPGGVKAAKVVPLPPEATSEPADEPLVPPAGGSVTAATVAKLEAAGRLDSPEGQTALALARRIDAGAAETGSSLAALARQHLATLAEAVKNAAAKADPLDELRARRERKLAGS